MKTFFSTLLLGLFGLFLGQCAHVEAPSGGKPDKVPPQVKGVFPAPKSTKVDPSSSLKFVFTEWINESFQSRDLQIAPPLALPPRVEALENELLITPREPLDTGLTYTFTLSQRLKDLHGNSLDEPFVLTFSTGTQIDTMTFEGQIFSNQLKKPPANTLVSLFPLNRRTQLSYLKRLAEKDTLQQDTFPRFEREPALYTANPDTSGHFKFQGLSPGNYHLLAFVDRNRNGKFESRTEEVAIAHREIALPGPSLEAPLVLNKLDNSPFYVEKINYLGAGAFSLQFNHPPLLLNENKISIRPLSDSLGPVTVQHQQIHPRNPEVLVVAEGLVAGMDYLLDLKGIQDKNQQQLDSNQITFPMSWQSPTTPLLAGINWSTPPSNSRQTPPDVNIQLQMRHPIPKDSVPAMFLLKEKDTLEVLVNWQSPFELQVTPTAPLFLSSSYQLVARPPEGARDTLTNQPMQPQRLLRFSTYDPLKVSTLVLQNPEKKANIQININHLNSSFKDSLQLNGEEILSLNRIPEGAYSASYFEDKNGNGTRDLGSLEPFSYAEPLQLLGDTLRLPRGDTLLFNFPPQSPLTQGDSNLVTP